MKRTLFILAASACLAAAASAGDIRPGSVPGAVNYQGRLERDNAPVTGAIHIIFRIYDAPASGTLLWTSPELVAEAAQGIFSASISPDWSVLGGGRPVYLEVQVEGDILSPREPFSSVAYAVAARKLEDGASVSVSTFTAAYQVLLATTANAMVGIGTNSPDYKLTVNGAIRLNGADGKICFPTGNCLTDALLATGAGGISGPGNVLLESGNLGTGLMSFNTGNGGGTTERMRINDAANNGTVAIGPAAITTPKPGVLDVDGLVYVSTSGISERNGNPVPFNAGILVKGGRVTGADSDYVSIGETPDVILFNTGGSERLRVHSNGYVGVGTPAPAYRLDVAGDVHTNTGLLASAVSVGAYGGWASAANEVRAAAGSHLLLQQNSAYNVGIGTETPREKLHVGGSVRAENGLIASTAAISGDAYVNGNFTANGFNRRVYLTSTTIYGTLTVSGGIGSFAGDPAYIASSNTFSGQNTFLNQVTVSSDVVTPNRLGAALKSFNFPGSRYLQVGDNKPEYSAQNTYAYIVGGDSADSRLAFYRGGVEAGEIGSQNGTNIGMVIAGSTKTLADAVYYRIQNSVVWISTGYAGTPAVYVSSRDGNVGLGTAVSDPNYKLTLAGSMHITGAGNGIVFPDGSVMDKATLGSASSLSNSGDAVVTANTTGSGGSVILRSYSVDGLSVIPGGNVGIGTLSPVSKLNVRGGDLVLGTPIDPYAADGVEDLIVAGNIVYDGALIQRSASATQLSGLVVAGNVYLSTGTSARTGIATNAPVTTLDVAGSGQFGSGTAKSTFTAAGVLQLASPLGAAYGGTGSNFSATGGANQFVKQSTLGGALTVGTIADADVPDTISINGTNNVTWASVNKTGSSLADLATRSAGALNSGTLGLAYGGTGSDFSGTGGASQFVKQSTLGGALTVGTISDADVPDNITISGTGNITWASVNKTGSSLADLATRSAGALNSGTLGLAYGGTGSDFSSTGGGASQFVKQTTLGGALTVGGIADADVPDNITINGTNNVTWASVNKTGSSLANLATRSASDLNSGTLGVAYGGTGVNSAGTANKVVCWNSSGVLGVCTSAPDVNGSCTCN